jgi:hypothetical protein
MGAGPVDGGSEEFEVTDAPVFAGQPVASTDAEI